MITYEIYDNYLALVGVMPVSSMYGFSIHPLTYGLYLIIMGLVGFYFFKWFELKIISHIFNMILLAPDIGFTYTNSAALINYSAIFAVGFLLKILHSNTAALLTNIKTAFIIFTFLCGAGIFASLSRGSIRK